MLVLLCLVLFVGTPLLAAGRLGETLFDVIFALVFVSGVAVVGRRRGLSIAVAAVIVATMALRAASFAKPDSPARLWSDGLSVVLLASFAGLVLSQVLREGPVTAYRIQGAIVVYLLLGFAWASAYELVHGVLGGGFLFPPSVPEGRGTTYGLVYFSFITLTTTGYGDVTPIHPVTRSLAIAEALTGQLYLAILIARLVSLRISSREK